MKRHSRALRIKIIAASLLGTTIEWYDFLLYGMAASLVFGPAFFPNKDPMISLLLSYATFSVAFIARPLGSVVFSHLGDKVGRKSVLMITLIGMGVVTTAIGILPTHEMWGLWAGILLTVLRFTQGIFVGGEWGGAVVYISEHAPAGQRGLYGSIPAMGVPLGLLTSTAVLSFTVSALSDAEFMSWGWRVPFLASVVLIVLGVWMRAGIPETEIFAEMKQKNKLSNYPLTDTFKYHWRSVLKLIGCKFGENVSYYIFTVYVIALVTSKGFSKSNVLTAINIAAFVCIFTILWLGYISDKVGKRNILILSSIGLILFAIPYFYIVSLSTMWLIFATVAGLSFIWASMYAVHGSFYPGLFPPEVRYTGASLGQQIAGPIAGGLAPFIATFLNGYFQSALAVAGYLIFCGLVTLVSVLTIPKNLYSEEDWGIQSKAALSNTEEYSKGIGLPATQPEVVLSVERNIKK